MGESRGIDENTRARHEGDAETPSTPCLVIQLYGAGYAYLLRMSRGLIDDEMTFASSMTELLPTGVGGTNRLKVEDFQLEFRRREKGQQSLGVCLGF